MPPSFRKARLLAALGFLLFPAAAFAQETVNCEDLIAKQPEFQNLSRLFTSLLAKPSLHCAHATLNSCRGERLDTHWHHRAVDADLMAQEMDAWREKAGRATAERESIAIVDGLFGPHISQLLQRKPTVESRTDFGADQSGHGSQTSQLAGGAPGLGVAPANPIFAYDVAADIATVETKKAYETARAACEAGHRIINVSLNTRKDRAGPTGAQDLSELVGDLAKKGCLLVKAAGNDAIQDSAVMADYVTDFQIYLSAGATRRSGGVAAFSDEGSVYAPGQDIAVTLPPSQVLTCGLPKAEAVLGGTSFAAPIVAGIAAQVLEVLDTSPKFRELAPLEQVRFLVRTVRESAESPTANVNGLRAVRAAMAWAAANGGPPAGAVPAECGKVPPSCARRAGATDCDAENACSASLRTSLALCPDRLAKQPLDALLSAANVDRWLALRLVDTFSQGSSKEAKLLLGKLVAQSYNDEYWGRELAGLTATSENLDNFLDLFARTRLAEGRKPNGVDESVIDSVLAIWAGGNRTANSFWNELTKRPELKRFAVAAARRALIADKPAAVEGPAVALLDSLNRAYGGSEEMGALALDCAKKFPAHERPFLLQYLVTLTMGPKRLPNTGAVVTALLKQAGKIDLATAIKVKSFLTQLKDTGRVSEAELAAWQAAL